MWLDLQGRTKAVAGTVEVRLSESAVDAPLVKSPCSTVFWIPNAATCTCATSTRESDDRMALATKWEVCLDQSAVRAHLPKEALQHQCLHFIRSSSHLRIADITSRVQGGSAHCECSGACTASIAVLTMQVNESLNLSSPCSRQQLGCLTGENADLHQTPRCK